ncbi:hypothetical protein [Sphingomonas sp. BK069]|uniref:hypothetical protein n=1 Tax=Sphingomonas sp. BK069 TaxID=2586979 RepID=UPI001621AD32|nr:hypothetical protein [Sphingomonas sp. BK069]MBB3349277.1 hypothetical protein [Sphingomonas sp. BK069]
MDGIDLSGVDPVRVPEARRRIEAIRTYMGIGNPSTADAVRIGESVGLSRWRFVRLVAAWRKHRDAKLLVMDRRNDSGPAPSISPVVAGILREVMREVGTGATTRSIAERLEARCSEIGLDAPARPTIWRELRKMQAGGSSPVSGPPRIVIARMWFQLPAEGQRPGAMPVALIAVMLPERFILARRVSVDPDAPLDVEALVEDVAGCQKAEGEARPLLIGSDDWRAAAATLGNLGLPDLRPCRRSLQIQISKAFGGRLGQLKVAFRALTACSDARPKTRQAQPLTISEVIEAIDTAVQANNAAVQSTIPPFVIS